jgi:hypothetical protein
MIHVHRGGQVERDAQGGQVGAQGRVYGLGQADVVDRAQGGVARVRAAAVMGDPGDVAALLVDGDHRERCL